MSQDSDQYGSYLPPIPPPPPPPPSPLDPWGVYPPQPPARRLEWHEIWLQMLTRPSVQSYREVLNDPEASPRRAYIWIFVTSTIAFLVSIIAATISPVTNELYSASLSFCCLPFVGALSILGLILGAGIYHLVARVLRGEGTFSQMVYLYGALVAPIQLISMIASFIPYPISACITGPLGIYSLVLTVIVIEAVSNFGWGRAVATALWWVPLACLCGCLIALLLSSTDSATFQNIIDSLMTPTP